MKQIKRKKEVGDSNTSSNDLSKDRTFHHVNTQQTTKAPIVVAAAVSGCLSEKHEECSGSYVDYRKAYIIYCKCPCHATTSNGSRTNNTGGSPVN